MYSYGHSRHGAEHTYIYTYEFEFIQIGFDVMALVLADQGLLTSVYVRMYATTCIYVYLYMYIHMYMIVYMYGCIVYIHFVGLGFRV